MEKVCIVLFDQCGDTEKKKRKWSSIKKFTGEKKECAIELGLNVAHSVFQSWIVLSSKFRRYLCALKVNKLKHFYKILSEFQLSMTDY